MTPKKRNAFSSPLLIKHCQSKASSHLLQTKQWPSEQPAGHRAVLATQSPPSFNREFETRAPQCKILLVLYSCVKQSPSPFRHHPLPEGTQQLSLSKAAGFTLPHFGIFALVSQHKGRRERAALHPLLSTQGCKVTPQGSSHHRLPDTKHTHTALCHGAQSQPG